MKAHRHQQLIRLLPLHPSCWQCALNTLIIRVNLKNINSVTENSQQEEQAKPKTLPTNKGIGQSQDSDVQVFQWSEVTY